MKELTLTVKDIDAWYDFDVDSEQISECFKAHVELHLLTNVNVTCRELDQSYNSKTHVQYDRDTYNFKINVVDGDAEDYDSVREGLEVTLNDTLGLEYFVSFEIKHLGLNNYQVVMQQTEDTVYC